MTDKMMSRRRLIEAAAGALLLSGCSSQDESSTKKVKKQGKIKKPMHPTSLSTCATKMTCMRSTTTQAS